MALREGDVISVTLSPSLRYTQYDSFKASATLRRTLTGDIDADVKDALAETARLYFKALRKEIQLWNKGMSALGDVQDTKALIKLCKREIGDSGVIPQIIVEPRDGSQGKDRKATVDNRKRKKSKQPNYNPDPRP